MSATLTGSTPFEEAEFAFIWEEAEKKFDDAIYRARTGDTRTANELWDELESMQGTQKVEAEDKSDAVFRELVERGQVSSIWL